MPNYKPKRSVKSTTVARQVVVKRQLEKNNTQKELFPIVCFGASAGGLEAFKEILQHLRVDLGMAYVLIMHLSPDHKSSLAEILQLKTKMQVHTGKDGMKVNKNHIYVIPPDSYMSLSDGHLKLAPRSLAKRGNFAVDYFLLALASIYKNKSIGVILSGIATDGTLGLKAIKAEGGISFSQDDSAKFSGMPRSAYNSGYADFVLSPEGIARELSQLAKVPYTIISETSIQKKQAKELKEQTEVLRKIFSIVKTKTGVDFFSNYKHASIYRRVLRRSALNNCKTLADYYEKLESKEKEVKDLYNDLLINVTSFFRDPEFYKLLEDEILSSIIRQRNTTDPIRIWIAGCSTGEEAYSVAIVVMRLLEEKGLNISFQIFASDLDEKAIEKARLGIYPVGTLLNVPEEYLRQYFRKIDGHYQIEKSVRELCVFSHHDLLKDPPFSRIDLISCQNVLIYLESDAQQKVLQKFHYGLKSTGFLFLGKSENIGAAIDFFDALNKTTRVFRRKSATPPPIEMNAPYQQPIDIQNVHRSDVTPMSDIQKEIGKVLLTRYVLPSVVVNHNMNITQFFGTTAPYLDPSMGKASFNVLKMIREDLLVDLKVLLNEAKRTQTVVFKDSIRTNYKRQIQEVTIEVFPKQIDNETFYLVVFKESAIVYPFKASGKQSKSDKKDERIIKLEHDSLLSRELLRNTNEEYESTLEELQSYNEETLSTNEELQSVNEELETSKEELQSANEELITINDELQKRNLELKESQNYSEAIVDTVNSPFLVLTSNLQIRSANQSFYNTFKVSHEQTIGSFIYELADEAWDIPVLREKLNDLVGTKRTYLEFLLSHYFPGLGELVFNVSGYRLIKEDSKETLILLDFTNISEVLKANQELSLLNEHLAQFAYVASHDLQEPLRKVMTFSNYISERSKLDSYAIKYLNKIKMTTERMSTLLKDLLSYSFLLKNSEMRFVSVDLNKTMKDVGKDLELLTEEKNAVLNIDSLPEILGEPVQINQLFYNLIINALKFSNGKPVITISIKNTSSEDRTNNKLKKDRRYACIVVKDNGIGFDQKYAEKIFTIFQRLNDKPEIKGSGMGLAICKKIVKDHEGAITAVSTENEGATFQVFLPIP